jgi:DNA repair protein SbcC/Rad50
MIPNRLEIHNFLPYRSPDPVYFDGVHLACLTGANGAGKSSLLDAITWALWGKARARRDDDLIHQGQKEMSVLLEFEQEGVSYEVFRQRQGGKSGRPILTLHAKGDDQTRTNLTTASTRNTQHKINEILRLDYETFVHSAFLQQGKADAFTTKNPADRKRILGDILGLARWRDYEERAKERVSKLRDQIENLNGAIKAAEDEIAQEPQYKREKANAEAAHKETLQALEAAEARRKEVEHAEPDLKHAREDQAITKRQLKGHRSDLDTVQQEIQTRQQKIQQYETVSEQAEQIEAGYKALQSARDRDSSLGEKLRKLSDIDRELSQLEAQIETARNELQREQHGYQSTITELQRALGNADSQAYDDIQAEITRLQTLDEERTALYDDITRLKEESAEISARQKILKAEGQTLNERLERLEQVEDATCPLCGQALDANHHQTLLAEIAAERDSKRDDYRSTLARTNDIQREIIQHQAKTEQMADDLKQLPALQSKAGGLRRQLDDARDAESRLQTVQAQLDAVTQALDNADYAHELRTQLAEVRGQREALGYDSDEHADVRSQLSSYQGYESQHVQLQIAQNALPSERDALQAAKTRHDRLTQIIEQASDELNALQGQIEALTALVAEFHRRDEEVKALRTRESTARDKLTTVKQKLNAIETQRQRKAANEQRRADAKAEQSKYESLVYAFGKNGVPAMIIETAIPELEIAANQLLARMTDGRMHLRLATQREKVTGGRAETLDIEIADELGTRNYEMYSGGESFRINFAIRVALSKMLARRAGAHLRTLFVDEGFGTQDDDGRNKLVEAITAIQDDFDMILVITHIDELRDSFPVHIVVDKHSDGSHITMR